MAPGSVAAVPGQGADAALTGALDPLPRSFCERPALRLARDLLGRLLVRRAGGTLLVGRIVETEAYRPDDPASHSFRGPTRANRAMFGASGHAYVYVSHGIHHCMNVVAGGGSAVLLRAVEPVQGARSMARRRGTSEPRLLCAGPGRLCQAFGISLAQDGEDLTTPRGMWLAEGAPVRRAARTRRVGLTVATEQVWRFVDPTSAFLSRPATWGRGTARGRRGSR